MLKTVMVLGLLFINLTVVSAGEQEKLQARSNGEDVRSLIKLGDAYNYGIGVPKDAAKAEQNYIRAAITGSADAQFALGNYYRGSNGSVSDFRNSAEWLTKSAQQGHSMAQLSLGYMYEAGNGFPKNRVVAYMLYNLSAAGGNEYAVNNRDLLEKNLSSNELAAAQRMSSTWKLGQPFAAGL